MLENIALPFHVILLRNDQRQCRSPVELQKSWTTLKSLDTGIDSARQCPPMLTVEHVSIAVAVVKVLEWTVSRLCFAAGNKGLQHMEGGIGIAQENFS